VQKDNSITISSSELLLPMTFYRIKILLLLFVSSGKGIIDKKWGNGQKITFHHRNDSKYYFKSSPSYKAYDEAAVFGILISYPYFLSTFSPLLLFFVFVKLIGCLPRRDRELSVEFSRRIPYIDRKIIHHNQDSIFPQAVGLPFNPPSANRYP